MWVFRAAYIWTRTEDKQQIHSLELGFLRSMVRYKNEFRYQRSVGHFNLKESIKEFINKWKLHIDKMQGNKIQTAYTPRGRSPDHPKRQRKIGKESSVTGLIRTCKIIVWFSVSYSKNIFVDREIVIIMLKYNSY